MESFIISGGNKLNGFFDVCSGKNAVLPILACTILSGEQIVLKNCPRITDIFAMLSIINSIGGEAKFEGDNIIINCKNASSVKVEEELTKGIRSSVFILGSILGRFKRASICYPGGCEIGKRPIDLHIEGLRALGVKICEENNIIECDGSGLKAASFELSFPSVGATENIMMAAVLTSGRTIITNAAKEPEIVDLMNFINAMGGKVHGGGSSTIVIDGVQRLSGGEYTPIPDRIVAGTILAAAAACGGKVRAGRINHRLMDSTLDVFVRAGCDIEIGRDFVELESSGRLWGVGRIETKPFPRFPTDMQPQIAAMLCTAHGTTIIEENLFESRFKYADELVRMGADLSVVDRELTINGVRSLRGAEVNASDLRGGAALIIAALAAEARSVVNQAKHIDRGYQKIEEVLSQLGASIVRK